MPRSPQQNHACFFVRQLTGGAFWAVSAPEARWKLRTGQESHKISPSRALQDNPSLRLGLASVFLHAGGAKARA
eukprot:5742343-Pyramimonas_sp.AAC.1